MLNITKKPAIVALSSLLLENLSSKALAQNGPPIPKAPCEIPPKNISLLRIKLLKTNFSKNMILIAKSPNVIAKIVDIIAIGK